MWFNILSLLVSTLSVSFGGAARHGFRCSSDSQDNGIGGRSFLLNRLTHWPNGIVPYELDYKFSPKQVHAIKEIIQQLQRISCVKWVPRTHQEDYVQIIHADDPEICSSVVGHVGGVQELFLGDDCFDVDNGYQGAILHEMLHTLGFIHEHQRIDRDCYVKVATIASQSKPFDYAIRQETSTSFPYDFVSIMHYGTNNFLDSNGGQFIGNLNGQMTDMDIMKLNNMYCGGKTYCQVHLEDCQKYEKAQKECQNKQESLKRMNNILF